MTIMHSDLPVSSTGIAAELKDGIDEAFLVFGTVKQMSEVGIDAEITVSPAEILTTITVQPDQAHLLSTSLTKKDDASEAASLVSESVKQLSRLGVDVAFTISPTQILATITVQPDQAHLLPALLKVIDDPRPGSLPTGQMVVKGSMCQKTVKLTVLIPFGWVTAEELAVLTGTASVDTTDLR
ncbi:hypothetical protein [Streptomyces sp. NPDC055607]